MVVVALLGDVFIPFSSSSSSDGCSFFRIYPSIFRQMSLSLAILWAFSMVLIPFNLSCFLRVARYVFLDFPLGFLTGYNASFRAFWAGESSGNLHTCPKNDNLRLAIVVDQGLVPVISYSF